MRSALFASVLLVMSVASKAESVNLYAAGSLKAALGEVVQAFESQNLGNIRLESTFGASGLLRERIEKDRAAHVFTSADLGHPTKLAGAGLAGSTVAVFARDLPALQIVQIASELNVSAEYGMIVLKDAPASATTLARFILGEEGQAALVKHGFGRGDPVK